VGCVTRWLEDALEGFGACWEGLEDPRTGNAALHELHDLLMIALCAVLCGGQNATDMAEFAKAKEPFLREFLNLKNGLPSHDTFSRLFRLLDPSRFGAAFQRFMAAFSEQCQGVVAIDGKVLRRSHNKAQGKSALHMVSAWQLTGDGANRPLLGVVEAQDLCLNVRRRHHVWVPIGRIALRPVSPTTAAAQESLADEWRAATTAPVTVRHRSPGPILRTHRRARRQQIIGWRWG
jgi:hypothetical protein